MMDYYKKKRTRSERNKLRPVINNVSKLRLGLFNQGKQSKTVSRGPQTFDDISSSTLNSVKMPSNGRLNLVNIPSTSKTFNRRNVIEEDDVTAADGPLTRSCNTSSTLPSSRDLIEICSNLTPTVDMKSWYPTAPDYLEATRKRLSEVYVKSLTRSSSRSSSCSTRLDIDEKKPSMADSVSLSAAGLSSDAVRRRHGKSVVTTLDYESDDESFSNDLSVPRRTDVHPNERDHFIDIQTENPAETRESSSHPPRMDLSNKENTSWYDNGPRGNKSSRITHNSHNVKLLEPVREHSQAKLSGPVRYNRSSESVEPVRRNERDTLSLGPVKDNRIVVDVSEPVRRDHSNTNSRGPVGNNWNSDTMEPSRRGCTLSQELVRHNPYSETMEPSSRGRTLAQEPVRDNHYSDTMEPSRRGNKMSQEPVRNNSYLDTTEPSRRGSTLSQEPVRHNHYYETMELSIRGSTLAQEPVRDNHYSNTMEPSRRGSKMSQEPMRNNSYLDTTEPSRRGSTLAQEPVRGNLYSETMEPIRRDQYDMKQLGPARDDRRNSCRSELVEPVRRRHCAATLLGSVKDSCHANVMEPVRRAHKNSKSLGHTGDTWNSDSMDPVRDSCNPDIVDPVLRGQYHTKSLGPTRNDRNVKLTRDKLDQSQSSYYRPESRDATITQRDIFPSHSDSLPVALPSFLSGSDTEASRERPLQARECTRRGVTDKGAGSSFRLSNEQQSPLFNALLISGDVQLPAIPDDALTDGLRLLEYNEQVYNRLLSAKKICDTIQGPKRARLAQVSYRMDHSEISGFVTQSAGSSDCISDLQAPQCFIRERDILDSIDDSQLMDELGLTVTSLHADPSDRSRKKNVPPKVPGRLVRVTDSDGSPVWDFSTSLPSLLARPVVGNLSSPELKYYKRRAF